MELLGDFRTSVKKAFTEIDPNWEKYLGLVVCGTHTPREIDLILNKIKFARERQIPFLGLCMGLELAVIEYYKNVLNEPNAISEELSSDGFPVVSKLPNLRVGIFPVEDRMESHWHNYAVKKIIGDRLLGEKTYTDDILEEWRLNNMIAVQYHPEYESSKDKPHSILVEFLNKCQKQ